MGGGSSVPREHAHRKASRVLSSDIGKRAGKGDPDAQEIFFQNLNAAAAEGALNTLHFLFESWDGPKKPLTRGAVEATCAASGNGHSDCLKYLLDHDVKPLVGRNDFEVNPLLHALDGEFWNCIELLLPRALKYKFSTRRLQEGLIPHVISGETSLVKDVLKRGLPANSEMMCCALLLGPPSNAADMLALLWGADLNELSSRESTEIGKGWEQFTPIHAACIARGDALLPEFVEQLTKAKADLSKWGKQIGRKSRFAKRLPLHYAAENPDASTALVEHIAKSYPNAMFASVNDVPGRALPCQCAGKHNQETQKSLERLMYEHLCGTKDQLDKSRFADALLLAKQAVKFEKVRTIQDSELEKGSVLALIDDVLSAQLLLRQETKPEDYWSEVVDYERENPVVDLGKAEHSSIKLKTLSDLGAVLKSEVWELLSLVDTVVREDSAQALPSLSELKPLLGQEVKARLDWAAGILANDKDARKYMLTRYAIFLSVSILAGGTQGDDERGEGASRLTDLSSFVTELAKESFDKVCSAYAEQMELPAEWNFAKLLAAGADVDAGMQPPVFSAGNLVLRRSLPQSHTHYLWLQDLFARTFLSRYTRDRGKDRVPERLELCEVHQVFNCGSWAEYARGRKRVAQQLMLSGPGWTGPMRTDVHEAGEPPNWQETGCEANEHWLFHGTSEAGEEGITEGDFRLKLAGSNVGTLYGNGAYMAECVSKSDEYTTPHSDGLRSILVCLTAMGRVNYNDDKRPDPDEMKDSCSGHDHSFHCVLGDREKIRGTYREIVLFDENFIYAAFVCRYRRVLPS